MQQQLSLARFEIANVEDHGYAYSYNPLFDDLDAPDELPHVIGRAPFGRIAIANSDAGARATVDSAIGQAHRAIEELTRR